MTIHKLVGKHTTGDVRNYVGSPGELFYDDATGLIRLADGYTEGGNALELNQFEDQFVMLTSYMADCEAATSISTDGVNWTDAFASTEYVDWAADYESVNFYQTAIGGGHIVYLGYDNDNGQNCLFWAETANQAANRSFSSASFQGDGDNGFNTNELWLEDVQYINGYFVAVGYQERYEGDYAGGNDVKYPFWAYSETGEHWTYGKIDYSYVRKMIDAFDEDFGDPTYGIRIESVGGGGNAGMMFTMRFYNYEWAGTPGFFYLENAVTGIMNINSHSGIPGILDPNAPFLANYNSAGFRSVWHDDHGWVVWANQYGNVFFNENTNPLEGKWRRSSWWQAAQREFGYDSTCIYWAAAGRLKDGQNWLMMTGVDGRYFATADQGRTWSAGVIGPCYNQDIESIETGSETLLHFDSNTDWDYGGNYNWTKIKITDSNIPEMNGIFYAYRYDSTTFRLSTTPNSDGWVDSTEWASYTNYDAICYFSYAADSKEYLTYGAGTFIAVDTGSPYVWSTTDISTPWNWEQSNPFDPVSGDITGNPYGLTNDFTWYSGNWKGVIAQYQWQGNWMGIGCISFGRIGTQSGLLRSQSRRVSGRLNSLNLADNFSVGVVNGVQGGENIGYGKIELRPGLPGGMWFIGAGYGFGPGTSIGSETDGDGEYNRVAITTMSDDVWSFRSDGIYYNDTLAVPTP